MTILRYRLPLVNSPQDSPLPQDSPTDVTHPIAYASECQSPAWLDSAPRLGLGGVDLPGGHLLICDGDGVEDEYTVAAPERWMVAGDDARLG